MANENAQATQPQTQQSIQPTNGLMALIQPNETTEFMMSPLGQQIKKAQVMYAMAEIYASSGVIPQRFAGKTSDCFIAIQMADRIGTDPITLMQNFYLVHNNPSFAAKFAISLFNNYGKYTHIEYRFTKDAQGRPFACRAYCYEIKDVERKNVLWGPEINLDMARAENWGPKWKTLPELMLRYRSSSWLINTIAPEVLLGMKTVEEVEDAEYSEMHTNAEALPQGRVHVEFEQEAPSSAPQNEAETAPEPPKEPKDEPKAKAKKEKEAVAEDTRDSLFG